jgi:hypothetical protein
LIWDKIRVVVLFSKKKKKKKRWGKRRRDLEGYNLNFTKRFTNEYQ